MVLVWHSFDDARFNAECSWIWGVSQEKTKSQDIGLFFLGKKMQGLFIVACHSQRENNSNYLPWLLHYRRARLCVICHYAIMLSTWCRLMIILPVWFSCGTVFNVNIFFMAQDRQHELEKLRCIWERCFVSSALKSDKQAIKVLTAVEKEAQSRKYNTVYFCRC